MYRIQLRIFIVDNCCMKVDIHISIIDKNVPTTSLNFLHKIVSRTSVS